MSSTTVYVPCDSGALSLGAEKVAQAIATEAKANNADIRVVRNGSRGLFWLEPLVEVATPEGRIAYGPVQARDVPALFDAEFLRGGQHALRQGLTEEIPYLKNQDRLTNERVGIINPICLDDYLAHHDARGHRQAGHRLRSARAWRRGLSDGH